MFDFIKELLWQMEGKEVTCAGGGTCSLLPMRRILSITQAWLCVVPQHFKNHGQASTFIIILPQSQCRLAWLLNLRISLFYHCLVL